MFLIFYISGVLYIPVYIVVFLYRAEFRSGQENVLRIRGLSRSNQLWVNYWLDLELAGNTRSFVWSRTRLARGVPYSIAGGGEGVGLHRLALPQTWAGRGLAPKKKNSFAHIDEQN